MSVSSAGAQLERAPGSQTGCGLAEIVRQYGASYQATHGLSAAQRKAMWAIAHCRTEALGGQREWCPECGFERYVYHSCRNRHCPLCQRVATGAWVSARRAELLPVPYFHEVFTLPHELNALIGYSERNQWALLGLLFDATAGTLLTFGRTELGGTVGFTLVLHTWDQLLRSHYHLHGLIPSGALSADGTRWVAGGRKFLFRVCGLSKMFRAKYVDGVEALLAAGALDLPPQLAELSAADRRHRWLRQLRRQRWVVYSQAPFAGPRKLVDYLGRYTYRVALGNERLVDCADGQVTFRYRDRRDGDRQKTAVLPAEEFLHRFLQHVLPDGFYRVRHYGLLANRGKRQRLAWCRKLLGAGPRPVAAAEPRTAREWLRQVLGIEVSRCPHCGAELRSEPLLVVRPPVAATYVPPRYAEFEAWNTS